MSSKSKKLSAVAGIFEQSVEGAIRKIAVDDIHPSEDQPRKNKDINIDNLAKSLKEEGLLQPIVVTKSEGDARYVIIAGERRFRAATSLGWKEIECRILSKDDKERFKLAVIENLQRENLDPIEESEAYRRLKNEYSYSDSELSDIIGKSRNYISEILSIAAIPAKWKNAARENGIESKNLLVQFAQAVKHNHAEDFLTAASEGRLSTVKAAKEFLRNAKQSEKKAGDRKNKASTEKKPEPEPGQDIFRDIQLSASWKNENTLGVQAEINLQSEKSVDDLEKILLKALQTALQNI